MTRGTPPQPPKGMRSAWWALRAYGSICGATPREYLTLAVFVSEVIGANSALNEKPYMLDRLADRLGSVDRVALACMIASATSATKIIRIHRGYTLNGEEHLVGALNFVPTDDLYALALFNIFCSVAFALIACAFLFLLSCI